MLSKKTLQTIGMTLLGAVGLLLAGALLFLGAWALLPDHTGETHSHDAPSFPSETEKAELYPWDRMTTRREDIAGSLDERELIHLASTFLPPQLLPYAVDGSEIEFLCDETQTLFGFRNATIMVRAYSIGFIEDDAWGEAVTDTESVLQYRFSLALREQYGSAEVCFVSLEPPPREVSLPDDEEAGLKALSAWLETRDLDLDSGSPFANFLWRYTDFCLMLECDYETYNAAMILFETGACEVTQEEHTVYCTFTGKEGEMTLLYDPVYQTVYGISLQR